MDVREIGWEDVNWIIWCRIQTDWCEHGNGMVKLHKMLVISGLSEKYVPCS
jgi:hypothetical protein